MTDISVELLWDAPTDPKVNKTHIGIEREGAKTIAVHVQSFIGHYSTWAPAGSILTVTLKHSRPDGFGPETRFKVRVGSPGEAGAVTGICARTIGGT